MTDSQASKVIVLNRQGKGRARSRTALSRREPAALQILELLRDRIVKGDIAPGTRIIERSLCLELNVSRTPLREALKLLEIDGLVEISQNKGARVVPFTEGEAIDLFEVLAGLEGQAVELAAERIGPADLEELEAMHADMRRRFTNGEKDAYFDLNSRIHETIVKAAGNPILIDTHAVLMLRAKRGRYQAIVSPARWNEAMEEHEAMMAALRLRDAPAAGRIWRTHLYNTGTTVAAVINEASRTG